MQLAAYALAAHALGAASVSSEYLFAFPEKAGAEPAAVSVSFDTAATAEAVASLDRAIGLLDATIRAGDLLPRTASLSAGERLCSFCDVASVCGPGHRRVYDAKRAGEAESDPDAPLFELEKVP